MENKEYYFISGLPRSGSTLLSAILRQNPMIYADIASELQNILENSIRILSQCEGSQGINDIQRENILRSITNGFYLHRNQQIIFDSSRGWMGNTSLLKSLFPYTKIICCVRDITWILDSFEKLSNNNPYHQNVFSDIETHHCVDSRCDSWMDIQKGGHVIKPWYWLREGLAANPQMVLLVEYNDLCKYPEKTIKSVYDFIGHPYYEHNFENVEYSNDLFDLKISSPNLHKISGKVQFKERKSILPNSVLEKYKDMEFWRIPKSEIKYV